MIDWKAHEIARQAASVAELATAQAMGRLTDTSRLNRAMAALRRQMAEYLGDVGQD